MAAEAAVNSMVASNPFSKIVLVGMHKCKKQTLQNNRLVFMMRDVIVVTFPVALRAAVIALFLWSFFILAPP